MTTFGMSRTVTVNMNSALHLFSARMSLSWQRTVTSWVPGEEKACVILFVAGSPFISSQSPVPNFHCVTNSSAPVAARSRTPGSSTFTRNVFSTPWAIAFVIEPPLTLTAWPPISA